MATRNVTSPAVAEQGLYVAYAALTTMAIVPIFFGSFSSLKKWKNPNVKKRVTKRQIDESDESEEDEPLESVSAGDAYMLPVLGSVALYGLYLASVHLDKTYVNYALTTYFAFMGVMATAQVGVNTLNPIIKLLGIKIDHWHINLARKSKGFYSASFTIVHLAMIFVSVLLSAFYVATKNWIVSNVFAISFALSAIQLLSLESFRTGIIFLSGLLVYDISWSFGSEAIMSVAKDLDVPIRVIFPRLFFGLPAGQAYKFAVLSLGDIVIPGVFIAFCLHFDQHRAGAKNPELGRSRQFRKPYFAACLTAYVLALGASFYSMHISKATQPALMYLSPACILSVLMTASIRGEMKQVFAYTSEEGLEAIRIKKQARDRKQKLKAQAKAQASRYARVSKLPQVIREESYVTSRSTPEPTSTTPSESTSQEKN
ncbi:hypothetical protein BGZ80_000796 [Entomortierella chlamydospora]|uniref:Signal peptide peptidase n=1 Tax=Entomortierella chlamydospora TaxID=101097 RepID=A0A9P6SY66_9FUNG|nr:hypothetical protein BGZ80_000796 [Entomortierella chlamydospora]